MSGTSEEIERDDNLAMNPAGESLIVQPREPIFNSESNYEELVHKYVSDKSEELPKECDSNQETFTQPKVAVDFSPFAISHTMSACCSLSDCSLQNMSQLSDSEIYTDQGAILPSLQAEEI